MELNYETNGQDFDFPSYDGVPGIRYIIASSPRCGSNMLHNEHYGKRS